MDNSCDIIITEWNIHTCCICNDEYLGQLHDISWHPFTKGEDKDVPICNDCMSKLQDEA